MEENLHEAIYYMKINAMDEWSHIPHHLEQTSLNLEQHPPKVWPCRNENISKCNFDAIHFGRIFNSPTVISCHIVSESKQISCAKFNWILMAAVGEWFARKGFHFPFWEFFSRSARKFVGCSQILSLRLVGKDWKIPLQEQCDCFWPIKSSMPNIINSMRRQSEYSNFALVLCKR